MPAVRLPPSRDRRGGGRPRVLIAAPHAPTRMGVRLALERDGFVVSAEETTKSGAVAAARREHPDVCLIDVALAGGGIEAAASVHAELPETPVVMMTTSPNDADLFASLEAGAAGYLTEEMTPACIGRVLHGVLRGEAALPRELVAHVIAEFRARTRRASLVRPTGHDLTAREFEVLDCLREGLSTRTIARRLVVTETTVRRHIGSILKKLDVPTRAAAVEVASRAVHES